MIGRYEIHTFSIQFTIQMSACSFMSTLNISYRQQHSFIGNFKGLYLKKMNKKQHNIVIKPQLLKHSYRIHKNYFSAFLLK